MLFISFGHNQEGKMLLSYRQAILFHTLL